jgi:CheY-like chemotaxis protein
MQVRTQRTVPLVVLGTVDRLAAQSLRALLEGEGASVAVAVGDRACLRSATALDPDIVLLDPRLPRALLSLLRAHPL